MNKKDVNAKKVLAAWMKTARKINDIDEMSNGD